MYLAQIKKGNLRNMIGKRYRTTSNQRILISLIVGFVVGFFIAQMLVITSNPFYNNNLHFYSYKEKLIIDSRKENAVLVNHDNLNENKSFAQKLLKEVKILCWISTAPKFHKKRAQHVKRTWGQRCNKLLFMSTEEDQELGSIALKNISDRYDELWGKTKAAFKYVYENYLEEYDWFLKADDDSYVIMENLRYLLYSHKTETPIYFGRKFKEFVKQGFMAGGSGYVLSREAVKRFIQLALPDEKNCKTGNIGYEDVEMGKCLEAVGVIAGDSRDSKGNDRFYSLLPEEFLIPRWRGKPLADYDWYFKYIYYKTGQGLQYLSDYAISFHYVPPIRMYLLEYFVYHLRAFDVFSNMEKLPKKLSEKEEIEALIAAENDKNTDSKFTYTITMPTTLTRPTVYSGPVDGKAPETVDVETVWDGVEQEN